MSEPHCQRTEIDGQPVIACGPRIAEGDMEVIREFSEYLKWHEMANPRTRPEIGDAE